MYKPPIMNPEIFLLSFKQNVLDKLADEACKDIIMMGNFNADVRDFKIVERRENF